MILLAVDPSLTLLDTGQRGDVLLRERAEGVEVEGAREEEVEVAGRGVALAIDLLDALVGHLVEVGQRETHLARVMAVERGVKAVAPSQLGVLVGIFKLRAFERNGIVEPVRVIGRLLEA